MEGIKMMGGFRWWSAILGIFPRKGPLHEMHLGSRGAAGPRWVKLHMVHKCIYYIHIYFVDCIIICVYTLLRKPCTENQIRDTQIRQGLKTKVSNETERWNLPLKSCRRCLYQVIHHLESTDHLRYGWETGDTVDGRNSASPGMYKTL